MIQITKLNAKIIFEVSKNSIFRFLRQVRVIKYPDSSKHISNPRWKRAGSDEKVTVQNQRHTTGFV